MFTRLGRAASAKPRLRASQHAERRAEGRRSRTTDSPKNAAYELRQHPASAERVIWSAAAWTPLFGAAKALDPFEAGRTIECPLRSGRPESGVQATALHKAGLLLDAVCARGSRPVGTAPAKRSGNCTLGASCLFKRASQGDGVPELRVARHELPWMKPTPRDSASLKVTALRPLPLAPGHPARGVAAARRRPRCGLMDHRPR